MTLTKTTLDLWPCPVTWFRLGE